MLLFTPKLAHVLESPKLIPKVLECLQGNMRQYAGLQIDVVCGVVDSMPPQFKDIPSAVGVANEEGLSILYGETETLLPNLENEQQAANDVSSKLGSIRMLGKSKYEVAVTLPLANTLFTNGNLSTLSVAEYTVTGENIKLQSTGPAKSIQSISIAAMEAKTDTASFIPEVPLTLPRRIVDGYGNIIRTLEFGDGNVLGASLELETKVPKYLATVTTDPTIEIWALLIPQHLSSLALNDGIMQQKDRYKISYWTAKGARLCRVRKSGSFSLLKSAYIL